jgi:predicted GNAT family acetyltransferase
VVVIDALERSRFEAHLGAQVAGFARYRRADGVTTFLHTEVDPDHEGRGIGSALARGALDAVRAAGGKARPLCPFIRAWIGRHPEYADLVVPEVRSEG